MIFVYIGICLLEAFALVLAVRRLLALQQAADLEEFKVKELRARNAELLMQMHEYSVESHDTQKHYRHLFNLTDNLVFVHEVTEGGGPGNFIEVNDMACELLGYSREELLEMTPVDIETEETVGPAAGSGSEGLTEEYVAKYAEMAVGGSARHRVAETLRTGHVTCQRVLKTRSGAHIPVEISARLLEIQERPVIMCTAHDLTSRMENEQRLEETQHRLGDFFDSSSLGIVMYDGHKELVQANASCLAMFGFMDQQQMAEFSLFDNPYIPADTRRKLKAGENTHYEMTVNFDEAVSRSLFVTSCKGKGYFMISMNNMGYDRNRRARGFFAQVHDITQHRRVEEQLRQMQESGDKLTKEGITGSLRDMSFTDMIQVLCAGGKSAEIALNREKRKGLVYIQEGNIIHCQLNGQVGPDAFYELMRWRDGNFVTKQCSEFPPATINASPMSLLMEGARIADEAAG